MEMERTLDHFLGSLATTSLIDCVMFSATCCSVIVVRAIRTFLCEILDSYNSDNIEGGTYKHDPEGIVTKVHFKMFSYFFAIEVCEILIDTG